MAAAAGRPRVLGRLVAVLRAVVQMLLRMAPRGELAERPRLCGREGSRGRRLRQLSPAAVRPREASAGGLREAISSLEAADVGSGSTAQALPSGETPRVGMVASGLVCSPSGRVLQR